MAKIRKMLGSATSPYIVSLMRLIQIQSTKTLALWCIDYSQQYLLPIYEKSYHDDKRLQAALDAEMECLNSGAKYPRGKNLLLDAVMAAAKEAEGNHAAQASARAIYCAAAVLKTVTHALGMVFYAAAARAYDSVGVEEPYSVYDEIAARECGIMEARLRAIAVDDEKDKVKIDWNC